MRGMRAYRTVCRLAAVQCFEDQLQLLKDNRSAECKPDAEQDDQASNLMQHVRGRHHRKGSQEPERAACEQESLQAIEASCPPR